MWQVSKLLVASFSFYYYLGCVCARVCVNAHMHAHDGAS